MDRFVSVLLGFVMAFLMPLLFTHKLVVDSPLNLFVACFAHLHCCCIGIALALGAHRFLFFGPFSMRHAVRTGQHWRVFSVFAWSLVGRLASF